MSTRVRLQMVKPGPICHCISKDRWVFAYTLYFSNGTASTRIPSQDFSSEQAARDAQKQWLDEMTGPYGVTLFTPEDALAKERELSGRLLLENARLKAELANAKQGFHETHVLLRQAQQDRDFAVGHNNRMVEIINTMRAARAEDYSEARKQVDELRRDLVQAFQSVITTLECPL